MALPKVIQYIDFGYTSAHQFWLEVVLPTYERFKAEPTRQNAILAALSAWHVHEWLWHEQHPGENTWKNRDYESFLDQLLKTCPELAWIRDIADASKHRGLGRSTVQVKRTRSENRYIGPLGTVGCGELALGELRVVSTPLIITLTDGSTYGFAQVLSGVIEFWKTKFNL